MTNGTADMTDPDNNTMLSSEEKLWEENPSLSEMIEYGVPPEYLVLLALSFCICIAMLVIFVIAANEHRQYSTKHTMQALCTVGVIFTLPFFSLMYFSGMVVPRSMSKVTYMAETYEAISLLFFLRLLLTYLGGKKETRETLTNTKVKLNSPPICCLTCLPHINFTKQFMFVNEMLIVQLVVCQLVLGYVDLLIGLDESHSHPTDLIEHDYSQAYHVIVIVSTLLAIYGLGGIYHTAEDHLRHYNIFRKFILYKAFLIVAKVQELLLTYVITTLVDYNEIDLTSGSFRTDLRVHIWCYFLIQVQALLVYPHLVKVYTTKDYPKGGEGEKVNKFEARKAKQYRPRNHINIVLENITEEPNAVVEMEEAKEVLESQDKEVLTKEVLTKEVLAEEESDEKANEVVRNGDEHFREITEYSIPSIEISTDEDEVNVIGSEKSIEIIGDTNNEDQPKDIIDDVIESNDVESGQCQENNENSDLLNCDQKTLELETEVKGPTVTSEKV